jgi:hypothetical protein
MINKKLLLIGIIFTATLLIFTPLTTVSQKSQPIRISENKEEDQSSFEDCSTSYCESLYNYIESLKESRNQAYEENRMTLYAILAMMVKWNTIKYVIFCA